MRFAWTAVVLAGCTAASPVNQPPEPRALSGELRTADRLSVGRVELLERGDSTLIRVRVTELTPGEHAIHIHEFPRCEGPDFLTSGNHFNPGRREHGLHNPAGPHDGDLPNIVVRADGTGELEHTTSRLTLRLGEPLGFDAARGSFIVHAGRDDHRTQPSGDSGPRVACAVFGAPAGRRRAERTGSS